MRWEISVVALLLVFVLYQIHCKWICNLRLTYMVLVEDRVVLIAVESSTQTVHACNWQTSECNCYLNVISLE